MVKNKKNALTSVVYRTFSKISRENFLRVLYNYVKLQFRFNFDQSRSNKLQFLHGEIFSEKCYRIS